MQQQQSLLSLGIKIRKSIQDGYKSVPKRDANGDWNVDLKRHEASLRQTRITEFYR